MIKQVSVTEFLTHLCLQLVNKPINIFILALFKNKSTIFSIKQLSVNTPNHIYWSVFVSILFWNLIATRFGPVQWQNKHQNP